MHTIPNTRNEKEMILYKTILYIISLVQKSPISSLTRIHCLGNLKQGLPAMGDAVYIRDNSVQVG
jgi:hypothetical protein